MRQIIDYMIVISFIGLLAIIACIALIIAIKVWKQ